MIVIAIAITYRGGIIAMIYGQIGTSCLAYFLNAYYTGKMLDYPITEQIQNLIPSLTLASIMGGGIYVLHYVHITNQSALLFAQIMTGIVLYSFLSYIFRISSFMEIVEMVKLRLLNIRCPD
jgi:hypothetical protein